MRMLPKPALAGCWALCCLSNAWGQAAEEAPSENTAPIASESSATGAARESNGSGIEEVIVTVRRREEALQNVPVSVSAISGESLAEQGIVSAASLQDRVPSLSLTTTGGNRDSLAFAIRGQRTNETQLLTDAPVGTYFAEVVQARNFGFGYTLFDLQSVQVLKGVQGTLFGRNVTGGAVLVEPQHPTDKLEASIEGGIGNYNLRQATGVVNLPLGDSVAVRFAGRLNQRDGFTREVIGGRDFDDQNYEAYRLSVSLKPADNLESLFIYDYFDSDVNGTGSVLTTALPDGPVTSFYSPDYGLPDVQAALAAQRERGPRAFASEMGNGSAYDYFERPRNRTRNTGLTNKTQLDLGGVRLRNIMGYRSVDSANVFDLDGSPITFLAADQDSFTDLFSEEFQILGSSFDDRLDYTLGLYYVREDGDDGARGVVEFPDLAALSTGMSPGDATNLLARVVRSTGVAKSAAAYAAGTYSLSTDLKLSGGIRYTWDKREARVAPARDAIQQCLYVFADGSSPTYPDCEVRNSDSWNAVTGDLTLSYRASNETNLYAAIRRGFRAGGFSLRAQSDAQFSAFDPEYVIEYEVGRKYQGLIDTMPVRLNVALFFQDYTDVQKQIARTIDGVTSTLIENTAKQENYGGEVEASWTPVRSVELSLFYSFVEARIKSGGNGDFALVGVPKHQAGFNFGWQLPLSADLGSLHLNSNLSYRSSQHLDNADIEGDEDGYWLSNVKLDYDDIAGSRFGLSAFANNLGNKTYRVGTLSLVGETGFASSVYGEPRLYGLMLRYRF